MDLKKVLRNPNTYIWLGSAVVVIGMILVLTHKKKSVAVVPEETPAPTVTSKTQGKTSSTVITNFDKLWDYKLENGVWYTKKKTTNTWSLMKDVASDYAGAVAKLTAFIKK